MKKQIEKLSDEQLQCWLAANKRTIGKENLLMVIALELMRRAIFGKL